MHPFLQSLLGGALIGAAAAGLMLVNGRVAGVSGILLNALGQRDSGWRWAFLGGLVLVGAIAAASGQAPPPALATASPGLLIAAGLLVGVGTQLGSGCTSGHGVCGLSNLSLRSLAATLAFMAAAAATVYVARRLTGGAP